MTSFSRTTCSVSLLAMTFSFLMHLRAYLMLLALHRTRYTLPKAPLPSTRTSLRSAFRSLRPAGSRWPWPPIAWASSLPTLTLSDSKTDGESCSKKSARWSTMTLSGVAALTVAMRGSRRRRARSPKQWPGPSCATSLWWPLRGDEDLITEQWPASMTKNSLPSSPSRKTTSPDS